LLPAPRSIRSKVQEFGIWCLPYLKPFHHRASTRKPNIKAMRKIAQAILLSLLLLCVGTDRVGAHNGQVALVYPVEGIVIDGDLADWPSGLELLPISQVEQGDLPQDENDFSASFRIGYSAAENALFIAVEVEDDSPIKGGKGDASWDTQDGCEIYIDVLHPRNNRTPIQYFLRGETPGVFGQGNLTDIQVVGHQGPTTMTYEWRIDIGSLHSGQTALRPDLTLGFDISIWDIDADGSASWIAWGKDVLKHARSERLGDLVLLAKDTEVAQATIDLQWQGDGERIARSPVLIQALADSALWVRQYTDQRGQTNAVLPAGRYRAEVLELGRDKSQTVEFTLAADATHEVILAVKPAPIPSAKAGPGTLHWRHFSIPDGLYSKRISRGYLDRQGFPWFGTEGGGVARFDGQHFISYTKSNGLANNTVTGINQDRSGQMWFSTKGNVISHYDGQSFAHFSTAWDGQSSSPISDIIRDSDDRMWIVTLGSGVVRFDGKEFKTFTTEDGLSSNMLFCAFEDAEKNLWFGSLGGGANRYDGKTFTHFTSADGLVNDAVYSITQDREGHMWFATTGGASRYDGKEFTSFTTREGLGSDLLSHVFEDSKGFMWFGSLGGGANRYDGKTFTHFTSADGLASDDVLHITEDREGHMWFATHDNGISRYDGEFTTFDASNGLLNEQVYDIFEDSQNRLWFATDGGLTRYDGEEFTHFTTRHGLASNHLGSWPFSIAEDERGYLYFATANHGISRYDGRHFTTLNKDDGLASNEPASIHIDKQEQIWISTLKGLSRYDGNKIVTFTTHDGLPTNSIGPIYEDKKGHLWLGTADKGISHWDGNKFTNLTTGDGLAGDGIFAFYEDRQGHLWISYVDEGISRWDGEKFTHYSVDDGLAHNVVRSISEDIYGHLWFATDGGGISRYDGTVFQTLLKADGLAGNRVNKVLHRKDGETWIATSRGATRYRPHPTPPPIHLKNIVANRNYGPLDSISLPSSQQYLSFEFEGISFKTRPGQMVYLYRLLGHDEAWQQTRNTHVEYSNLPVGNYTFEVKAVNRDLVYSLESARVDVEVYYQPMSSSVRISEPQVQDVFASFYKTYAQQSIGSVLVSNDDPNPVEANLSFYIPDLMARPTEKKVLLEPQSTQRITLRAVLDPKVLNLEGANPVQAEIALSCQIGEQTISVQESYTLTAHGRGALTWDDLGRAAAFITPEDRNVAAFARSTFETYRPLVKGDEIDGHLPTAMLLFEALNIHGIKYVRDPSTPYAQVRADRFAVDHIQYPSELLHSRQGDCDDVTVLYCALLENLDIATALIDAPEHILMMFDTGLSEGHELGFRTNPASYIMRNGHIWIPVEMTKLGEGSFLEAWDLGARICQRLASKNALHITDVRTAWPQYPYAMPTASEVQWTPSEPLQRALLDGLHQFRKRQENHVEATYIRPLLQNPRNYNLRIELAKTRIESAEYNDAIATLMPLLDTRHKAESLYLIGYAYAGKEDYQNASHYVAQALTQDPDNFHYQRSFELLSAAAKTK